MRRRRRDGEPDPGLVDGVRDPDGTVGAGPLPAGWPHRQAGGHERPWGGRRLPRYLAAALAADVTLALLTSAPLPSWLLAAAVAAVLGVSGWLWMSALVGRAATGDHALPASRYGLYMVAGLALLPALALSLYVVGLPITRTSGLLGLIVTSLAAGLIADARQRRTGRRPEAIPLKVMLVTAVALTVMVAAIGGVLALYRALPHPAPPAYTALSLGGWASDVHGVVAVPAGGVVVPLEISRRGGAPVDYRLTVELGGRPSGRPQLLAKLGSETRQVSVRLSQPPDGCVYRMVARLRPVAPAHGSDLTTTVYVKGHGRC